MAKDNIFDNPFEPKDQPAIQVDKKTKFKYRTAVYELTDRAELDRLATDLSLVANHSYKHGIIEFTYSSKVDGSPFLIARFRENLDIALKDRSDFSIFCKHYMSNNLGDLDDVLNSHDNSTIRMLGEKRFSYKTGEVGFVLVWCTICPGTRDLGGVNAIRNIFRN